MRVSVVTPDTSFFDGDAVSVNLQAVDGRFGILKGHAPLIARLGHGLAVVDDGTKTHQVAIYGGFVKVQDDIVSVLAGGAATTNDGDAKSARQAHDDALAAVEKVKDPGPVPPELGETLLRAKAFLQLFEV